ncbi:TPA: hypothetical protein PRY62_004711 [Escherichia coli]|nr:hypothetical protein [Escherichia coli]
MSYQFIHVEDYGRVVSKKKKNDGSNNKYKKELEKYSEFFNRVKKYYGDRFSDFLEKIKPKTTIKPK